MSANPEKKISKFSRLTDVAFASGIAGAVSVFGVAWGNPEAGIVNGALGAVVSLANSESERAVIDIANGSDRFVDRLRARGGTYVAFTALGAAAGMMLHGIEGASAGAASGVSFAVGLERFIYNRRLRGAQVDYADLNTQSQISLPQSPLRVA